MRIILTGGERNDITQIEPLLDGIRIGFVIADKAYDATCALDAAAACGAPPRHSSSHDHRLAPSIRRRSL